MFEPIREKLKEKLESLDEIQEVFDYQTEEFNGYPAVVLLTTRNEAEFETTIHNKRTYVFTAYIFEEIEHAGDQQKARRTIEGAVDAIMDALDQDQQLADTDLPTKEDLIISSPSLSSIYVSDDAKYVIGEMEISIMTSFDTTT